MATIKQLTTEALQEVEDGKVYDALRTIIAAIEELSDDGDTLTAYEFDGLIDDDFNDQW